MALRNAAGQPAASASEGLFRNRWVILLFSVISMVAVANLQYGWTLFVPPLSKQLGQDQTLIQVAFTVFVLLETWLVPFEGFLVDKFGPRLLVMLGGVLAGLGWVGSGYANSLTSLYLAYAVAGLGAGIVYGTAIGSALKWFPDRLADRQPDRQCRLPGRVHPVGHHPGHRRGHRRAVPQRAEGGLGASRLGPGQRKARVGQTSVEP